MATYGSASYWNERYLKSSPNESYEWYNGYKNLRRLLNPLHFATQSQSATIRPKTSTMVPNSADLRSFPTRDKCRVLILGCGNSTFGEDMLKDGWWGGIVNVDFSQVVVDQMSAKYNQDFYRNFPRRRQNQSTPPPMEFHCADMTRSLPFEDESFDLVVCKGSFDAVLCGAGSVANVHKVVQECVRLLAPGHGILFIVTPANPDNRVVFLERDNDLKFYWKGVSVYCIEREGQEMLENPRVDYVYICRKRLGLSSLEIKGGKPLQAAHC